MVSFPNGKINLGLRVTRKRADGFHDIETVFYPIAIHDVVDMVVANKFSFTSSGIAVDGSLENNLCVKAHQLIKNDYPLLPFVAIHLLKNIPIGAGLGGGSADAVACLQLLNHIGKLDIPSPQLSEYALQLGSDCPFFLLNKPCLAMGRGEQLTEINVDLSAYDILIVNPGIHISTGWAFSALKIDPGGSELRNIVQKPVHEWKGKLQNDFEQVVFEKYAEIKDLKEYLYERGAVYASLSGSGSTVYGLFKKGNRPGIHLPSAFVKWL